MPPRNTYYFGVTTDFMTGMFKVSDPSQARGNNVTAREILDQASREIGTGLSKDPEIQSQMTQVIASTYTNLGLYPRAHELAKRALDARQSLLGPDDPKTLESMVQMGFILDKEGHFAEAETLDRQALADERRILGREDPLTLETMGNLAFVVLEEGHFDEGERLAREAIKVGTRTVGPESAQVRQSMKALGNALWYQQSRSAEAEQEDRELIDVDRRVLGSDHPETLTAMNNLGLILQWQDRFAEAEQLDRETLATGERVLGADHPLIAAFTYNLVFLSITAWAQSSDPIVGTWNLSAFLNGSPLFIGVMTFHEGGTVTEFDTAGTNASAYESIDSGVWKNLGNGSYNFKAENFAYDNSGNLSQLQVPVCHLTLGPNQKTLKGGCNITYYSCSLSQCPGTVQLNFSYQIVAKRF